MMMVVMLYFDPGSEGAEELERDQVRLTCQTWRDRERRQLVRKCSCAGDDHHHHQADCSCCCRCSHTRAALCSLTVKSWETRSRGGSSHHQAKQSKETKRQRSSSSSSSKRLSTHTWDEAWMHGHCIGRRGDRGEEGQEKTGWRSERSCGRLHRRRHSCCFPLCHRPSTVGISHPCHRLPLPPAASDAFMM